MTYLVCKSCGAALTGPVQWADFSVYDYTAIDTMAPLPLGHIVRQPEDDATPIHYGDGRPEGLHVYSLAGAISVHPEDVIRDQIESCGKDYGCCGSGGHDGDNRACRCGAVLGTEWSDCYTQAEVRFRADAVATP